MPTCQCCGQNIPSSRDRAVSATAIWVDQPLMECCNSAFEMAASGAAGTVEVAHLLHVIAAHRHYRSHLESVLDLRADGLVAITRDVLEALPRSLAWGKPQTSRDLKMLIERAWGAIRVGEDRAVTLHDCLETLLYDCNDLACGQQLAGWRRDMRRTPAHGIRSGDGGYDRPINRALPRAQSRNFMEHAPPVQRQMPPQPWPSQHRPVEVPSGYRQPDLDYGRSVSPARRFEASGADAGSDVLQLLARQERLLAQICAHMSAGNDAGVSRSGTARATRRKAPSAATLDGFETVGAAPAQDLEAQKHRTPPAAPVEHARPPAPQPPAPSRHLKLHDRFRRGTWLQRPSAVETRDQSAVATMERTERGPRLSLVQAQSPERMAVPRALSELADDEDDVVAFEDDAGDDGAENGERIKRFYLEPDDDIVRAPSIGPKTAARIMSHGIVRVRDLLVSDPRKLAARIGARHITPERIALWQDQARLVCTVPWLRGTHAQILVGAGFNTVKKILSSEPIVICAAIRIFATTREGQSVLRSGPPPDDARVFRWVAHAQVAEAERAA